MKIFEFLLLTFLLMKKSIQNSTEITLDNKISLIGFGSPIIDGVINYDSDQILGNKIKDTLNYHMSGDFPIEFYLQVMRSENTSNLLGGSAMNTIRAANYILQLANKDKYINKVGYLGAIGKDEFGSLIKRSLDEEGIIFFSQELELERTSTSIVLIENLERSFFSDLGASEGISVDHFQINLNVLKNSQIFYADAYLIGKRLDCFQFIYKHQDLSNENILMALNIASDNIVRDYFDNILEIIPYLDIMFINKEEMKMMKNKFNIEKSQMNNLEFLEFFSNSINKINKNKKRIIVNTRGVKDTLVYIANYKKNTTEIIHVPINKVKKKHIADLNGAGDAFAGGFMAGLLLNLGYRDSTHLGNKLASEVIKLTGFQTPSNLTANSFNLNLNSCRKCKKEDL